MKLVTFSQVVPEIVSSQADFLNVIGLVVTSTFDLLTSKYHQFTFIPNCT